MPLSLERIPMGFCPSDRHYKISKWISSYSLRSFHTVAFTLGPQLSEFTCEPFKSRISILYSPVVLLDISPVVFRARHFGTPLSSAGLKGWGAWGGHKPLSPQGKVPYLWDPSQLWVTVPGVGVLVRLHLCFSLPISMWPFYPSLWINKV